MFKEIAYSFFDERTANENLLRLLKAVIAANISVERTEIK